MKASTKHLFTIALALIFSYLFFERSAGLNLLIFDILLLAAIFKINRAALTQPSVKLFYASTLASAIMVAWHNSAWSIVIHHMSFGLLGGALAAPQLKSVFNIMFASFFNVVYSLKAFFKSRKTVKESKQGRPFARVWYALRISFIPLLAVLLFGTLYSNASPWFQRWWREVENFLNQLTFDLFEMVSFTWFFTFLLGLLLTIYILFAKSEESLVKTEKTQGEDVERKRERYRGKNLALKREAHVALVLFISLNIMLLMQNVLDISHVWFGFEWNGEYLKQFVHEGTYLLIFAIIVSMALVLYYFRGNINFYKKNKTIKTLAYIWIFQNMVLALSVAIRNVWYIEYFNLAYKRIGVFFFLLAVIYGLYTIYVKVNQRKSLHYLVRTNSLAVFLLLLSSSFVNWDVLISSYNFNNSDSKYIHLKFLAKMNDASLPYLMHDKSTLEEIVARQDETYGPEPGALNPTEYVMRMNTRKTRFIEKYEKRNWLEWNFADWRAYKKLSE